MSGARGRWSTTEDVLAGVDLSGKTYVVTGASGGLGEETARALAAHGATVVGTARDDGKARAATERILATQPAGTLHMEHADLASLRRVRSAVDHIAGRYPRLHGVIANAGVMAAPRAVTEDGFELHFGTNHLGHFAFVTGLAAALAAGAPARVVVLSSVAHRWSDIDLDDPNFDSRDYHRFRAYGASKTANVLFALELDRRMRNRGVRAFAVHPGGIHSDLGRHLSDDDRSRIARGAAATGTGFKSLAQGAATSVWALTSTDLNDRGGLYLEDCAVAEVVDTEQARGVRSFAVAPQRAARLWELSERLTAAPGRR